MTFGFRTSARMIGSLGVLLLSMSTNPALADGGSDGGGGDVLRFAFEAGRTKSQSIVRSVELYHWNWFGQSGLQDQKMRGWFFSNKAALADAIESMKIMYRSENPNGFCAQTELVPGATVYLSTEKCRGYTETQATQQLMVEAAHHFGFNDREADILSINLMKIYSESKTFRGPLWAIGSFGNPGNSISVDSLGRVSGTGVLSNVCFIGYGCFAISWDDINQPKRPTALRLTGQIVMNGQNILGHEKESTCQIQAKIEPTGNKDHFRLQLKACEFPFHQDGGEIKVLPATNTIVDDIVRRHW